MSRFIPKGNGVYDQLTETFVAASVSTPDYAADIAARFNRYAEADSLTAEDVKWVRFYAHDPEIILKTLPHVASK